ncbi:MAG: hypothetical protein NW224_16855 [Leptolyngbyaceae cyanobacterium bins.302]|nr:hypothetical protein [Leptolyngbyaceae cyanobacterium bins.302]
MNDFSFINDNVLQTMIERDKEELDNSLKSGLWKATLLLAGSIIEAILVDYFLTFPPSNDVLKAFEEDRLKRYKGKKVEELDLVALISIAVKDNLISEDTSQVSTVIKNYRNLIHPGRELRRKEKVNEHTATVAKSLVEIVINEIRQNYAAKHGYRAENAIEKVKIDPSCSSIFNHMISQMNEQERTKLFILIPQECSHGYDWRFHQEEENFLSLHYLLSNSVPDKIIKEEVEKINFYLSHKTPQETLSYCRFFIKHLKLLDSDDRKAFLQYFLDLLKRDIYSVSILTTSHLRQLAEYMEELPAKEVKMGLLEAILAKRSQEEHDYFISVMEAVYFGLPNEYSDDVLETVRKRYPYWANIIDSFTPF